MNPALIELIILAGIAVFLFLRLKSVLGTREGFEKPRMQPKNDAPKRDFKVIDGGEDKDITDNVEKNSKSAKFDWPDKSWQHIPTNAPVKLFPPPFPASSDIRL